MEKSGQVAMPEGMKIGEFVPVAYYDKHMDCIRVYTHDRSVTEVRVDRTFTLHRCNHAQDFDPKYVGFTIKGVKHVFDELELPLEGVLTLARILNAIIRHKPGSSMAAVADLILSGYGPAGDLRVHLDERSEDSMAA